MRSYRFVSWSSSGMKKKDIIEVLLSVQQDYKGHLNCWTVPLEQRSGLAQAL